MVFHRRGTSITVTPNSTSGGVLKVSANRSDVSGLTTSKELTINRPVAGASVPGISGSNYICSGTSSYAFSSLPAGATVNWTVSGGSITIPPGSTGSTVNATFSYYGVNTLNAAVDDGCAVVNRSIPIQAGPYSTSQFSVTGPSEICAFPDISEVYVSINVSTAPPAITGYNWTYSTNWTSGYSPSGNDYKLVPPNPGFGVAWVKLSIENACGWSVPWQWDIWESTSGCSGGGGTGHGRSFAVSPNPVDDVLTLLFENEIKLTEIPETIELFSEQTSQLVKAVAQGEKTLRDGNKLDINVASLPKGVYFLHVTDSPFLKDKTKKIKIVLK